MTKTGIAACTVILLAALGCRPVPFREPVSTPFSGGAAQDLIGHYRQRLPLHFRLLNSIVFEYNWQAFSGIGYLEVDRRGGVFKVVCLNPMGVKLFELAGDQNQVTDLYTIAALNRFGNVTGAVGVDIRRMYLNATPSAEAKISWRSSHSVRLREESPEGTLEYVFAGPEGDLAEKNCYKENGLAWRASYHEYREENGKRFPGGILFLNYDQHYRLIVRQREFVRENNQTGN
jgi:hypothetical protein